jgi:NAD(P)-dependent dehydrogenase (short-subunit alcohol dehydrogenase family)
MSSSAPELDLGLRGAHVVITGGAGLIGSVVVEHFVAAGARVSNLDITHPENLIADPGNQFRRYCDVSSEESVKRAFEAATKLYGPVIICVALASLDLSILQPSSFVDASFSQLKRVLDVNVAGTWLTAREWLRGIRKAKEDPVQAKLLNKNVNLIIIGSESGHFGERLYADYSLGKSAVQGGLLMSLRAEVVRVHPTARVNAVAPGPVDTERWARECRDFPEQYYLEAQATVSTTVYPTLCVPLRIRRVFSASDKVLISGCGQTALGKPIPISAVAKTILMLASENFSSHVHGQVINVDGGKQGKVIWTKEEVNVTRS